MGSATSDPRRGIPRTDAVLADARLAAAAAAIGRVRVKVIVAGAQQRARQGEIAPDQVLDAAAQAAAAAVADAAAQAAADDAAAAWPGAAAGPLDALAPPSGPAGGLRPVLNATGVVLHTNLGRAVLSTAAVSAIRAASGYTDVELELATGRRARRGRPALAALAAAVPDAADVHVVNNGAAALVLAATALAYGREIVISRGELVEIGDGFRLPDLLVSTGARLREVGTTNRTSIADFAAAIGPDTGFVLKVHPSNFVIRGFTAAVPVEALASLGALVVVDIGSGLLAPDPLLPAEPDAASALRAGAALVTASGDKLLGGPQAGLLLGRSEIVDRLRRHPLARALRVDKLTLAALAGTLGAGPTPTWESLRAAPADLLVRAQALCDALAGAGVAAEVAPSRAVVGGGGAPGLALASWAVALPQRYAAPLRLGAPPVIGRTERGRLLLDLRCVPPAQDAALLAAVLRTAPGARGPGTGDRGTGTGTDVNAGVR